MTVEVLYGKCLTVDPQQQQPGGQEQEQEMLTGECLRCNPRHQPLTETLQFNDDNNNSSAVAFT